MGELRSVWCQVEAGEQPLLIHSATRFLRMVLVRRRLFNSIKWGKILIKKILIIIKSIHFFVIND